jgi:hypothetical protein
MKRPLAGFFLQERSLCRQDYVTGEGLFLPANLNICAMTLNT